MSRGLVLCMIFHPLPYRHCAYRCLLSTWLSEGRSTNLPETNTKQNSCQISLVSGILHCSEVHDFPKCRESTENVVTKWQSCWWTEFLYRSALAPAPMRLWFGQKASRFRVITLKLYDLQVCDVISRGTEVPTFQKTMLPYILKSEAAYSPKLCCLCTKHRELYCIIDGRSHNLLIQLR